MSAILRRRRELRRDMTEIYGFHMAARWAGFLHLGSKTPRAERVTCQDCQQRFPRKAMGAIPKRCPSCTLEARRARKRKVVNGRKTTMTAGEIRRAKARLETSDESTHAICKLFKVSEAVMRDIVGREWWDLMMERRERARAGWWEHAKAPDYRQRYDRVRAGGER